MRRHQRGVLLVTALFIVLLVGLFGSAMLTNGPAMARQANQASDEVQAQRAAETGAAYARLQLREDAEWKGNLDTTTVDLPDFKVTENQGNVIGWIKDSSGAVSMFRIRFNYQDGSTPGGDDLTDPPANMEINTTYLSVNNVPSDDDKVVPDVNASTFKVDDPAVGANNAPAGCVFLRIEGLAGPGLASSGGPTDPPGPGSVVSRALRAIYGASVSDDIPDSALSAGNGIAVEVEEGADVTASTGPADQTVKFRSKKDLSVKSATGSQKDLTFTGTIKGKLSTEAGASSVQANLVGDADPDNVDTGDFHHIEWGDVPKASTSGDEAIQLPAGIYVSDYTGKYHYYDQTFDEYKANTTIDPATGLHGTPDRDLDPDFGNLRTDTLGTGIATLEPDPDAGVYAHTLSITKDVNFNASAKGNKNVIFMTPNGRELYEDDDKSLYVGNSGLSLYEFTAVKMENTKISSPGDLGILIDVEGVNASLTAEGDATVAAPSVKLELEDGISIENLDQRLSVYTQKDLTVSTFLHTPPLNINAGSFSINIPEMKQYGTLNLQGLLYSWGDATVYGGTPGVEGGLNAFGMPRYGEFNLAGALVAYGGDPASGSPGSEADKGKISYHGRKAEIDYDATKLVADPSTIPVDGLPALLRKSYGFEN